jgi:hypothetical protein
MVVLTLTLTLLSQTPSEPPDREAPRLLAEVGGVITGGAASVVPAVGVGVTSSIGTLLSDRVALAVRLQAATIGLIGTTGLGLALEYVTENRWSVGSGVDARFVGNLFGVDLPAALVVQVPFRVRYQFSTREPAAVRRKGLALFLEVAPGVAPLVSVGLPIANPPPPGIPFSLAGALGVTYLWD